MNLRRLSTIEEYRACVQLQRDTWGGDFDGVVPLSILKVSQRIGGVCAGAFDEDGALVGFVFGMTGVENRRLVHWSDMLAVRPGLRDKGLGVRLKAYQRELLRPLGVETVYWTYDPLEAKNAHLNLNKLGAHVHEYVENMYGDTGSVLHQGLGTDRFIVAWDIESPRVEEALSGNEGEVLDRLEIDAYSRTPIVNTRLTDGSPEPKTDFALVNGSVVRVEVPASIQSEKQAAPDRGERWRASTRRAFLHYLSRGYEVRTLYRDKAGRCFYLLDRD